jgi:hypothetical protein
LLVGATAPGIGDNCPAEASPQAPHGAVAGDRALGPAQAGGEFRDSSSKQVGARRGGTSSRAAQPGKGCPRRLPAASCGPHPDPARPPPPRCAQVWGGRGATAGRQRGLGGGSPFWPLSAAYQDSERKAHRQKSSSVKKVPLRSLISSGARRAPAGPRPHGPGHRGRGAGAGRRRGPRPRGEEGLGARGRAGMRRGRDGDRARGPRWLLLRGAGHWRPRLGGWPGRAGQDWAARAAARPESGAAAESTAKGGAARI